MPFLKIDLAPLFNSSFDYFWQVDEIPPPNQPVCKKSRQDGFATELGEFMSRLRWSFNQPIEPFGRDDEDEIRGRSETYRVDEKKLIGTITIDGFKEYLSDAGVINHYQQDLILDLLLQGRKGVAIRVGSIINEILTTLVLSEGYIMTLGHGYKVQLDLDNLVENKFAINAIFIIKAISSSGLESGEVCKVKVSCEVNYQNITAKEKEQKDGDIHFKCDCVNNCACEYAYKISFPEAHIVMERPEQAASFEGGFYEALRRQLNDQNREHGINIIATPSAQGLEQPPGYSIAKPHDDDSTAKLLEENAAPQLMPLTSTQNKKHSIKHDVLGFFKKYKWPLIYLSGAVLMGGIGAALCCTGIFSPLGLFCAGCGIHLALPGAAMLAANIGICMGAGAAQGMAARGIVTAGIMLTQKASSVLKGNNSQQAAYESLQTFNPDEFTMVADIPSFVTETPAKTVMVAEPSATKTNNADEHFMILPGDRKELVNEKPTSAFEMQRSKSDLGVSNYLTTLATAVNDVKKVVEAPPNSALYISQSLGGGKLEEKNSSEAEAESHYGSVTSGKVLTESPGPARKKYTHTRLPRKSDTVKSSTAVSSHRSTEMTIR